MPDELEELAKERLVLSVQILEFSALQASIVLAKQRCTTKEDGLQPMGIPVHLAVSENDQLQQVADETQ
ncbi:hypothetical protein [Limnohabitans radicicola]|uniref:Uncharacterized protein n=1 Tax=Limnohabitans radicicola TaxID=2771427 RepID=A0A927FJZ3_9BURK|nr:hypothetical protein [Limnohabitans radicicola]MBD8051978.1 hypothetical protein [Limnohabitans radicicola]